MSDKWTASHRTPEQGGKLVSRRIFPVSCGNKGAVQTERAWLFWGSPMQTLSNDLHYAFRQLRKTPGLTLLAILSLTLGIGANTAIFTVIESVLLRPLPYAHSDRLVFIGPATDKPGFAATSWLNYRDVRAQ